jgi:hypothetical protein
LSCFKPPNTLFHPLQNPISDMSLSKTLKNNLKIKIKNSCEEGRNEGWK